MTEDRKTSGYQSIRMQDISKSGDQEKQICFWRTYLIPDNLMPTT